MANTIKVKLLDSGIAALFNLNIDFLTVYLHSFKIGNTANFDVGVDEVEPRGTITYIGSRDSMKLKIFNEEKSLKIQLIIPEQYDDITVGNIVIYALHKGIKVPFCSLVLSEVVIKRNPTSSITDKNYKYPGNRMLININVNYVNVEDVTADYQVVILTPNFANLPYFGKDLDIPVIGVNPHAQFVVNEMQSLGSLPAFVTKSADNSGYFAAPMFQNIDSPKFGVLNSFGLDVYDGDRITWVWGQTFTTPNNAFSGIIGGAEFTDSNDDLTVIGGLEF